MTWNEEQLHAVLEELRARRGDSTSVEVKRAAGGVPKMAETLCAFANMPNGGTVILGVDEAQGDFTITGVADVAAMQAGLVAMARESITPAPYLDFQDLTIQGKQVVIVHVSPLRLSDKPASVRGRAYLRQADGDYPMHSHELRMLEVAKLHHDEQVDYDLLPARGRNREDLLPELLAEYVESVRARDKRLREHNDDEILRMTSVLSSSGEPTIAGLYALGAYPQGQYPALTVTAAVQLPGGEGQARNRNVQDFTGPIPVLLEDAMQWVENNLDTVRRYREDGHMEEVCELPLNAVRELLANALVHRDLGPNTLGTGKQVQIRLTPRSFFVQSPGGLRGVSLAQLESVEHAQAAVNQRVYHMAKCLKTADRAAVIEGEGGGIAEVFRSVRQRLLPAPQLIDTGVQFKALLWRERDGVGAEGGRGGVGVRGGSADVALSHAESGGAETVAVAASSEPTRNEPRVLAVVSEGGALTIQEIAQRTGLNLRQVRYALERPLAEGIVLMEGKQGQKTTRYTLGH